MVIAEYCPQTGRIYTVVETYNQLEDPSIPISDASTKVHGITDAMVKGHKIDDEKVNSLISNATSFVWVVSESKQINVYHKDFNLD